jgi:uncharacterized protein (DUF924 family)
LVLDQYSRSIFRDTPHAFARNALAQVLTQETVAGGHDQRLGAAQRAFAYMRYMHSESSVVHAEAVRLLSLPGLENNLAFELRHKAIVDRFGRYPHRNAILGRESNPKEQAFLSESGSSF